MKSKSRAAQLAGVVVISVCAHPLPVCAQDCPEFVGSITTGVAYVVAVSGTYAYVAAELAGLRVIDVSTPASPVEVGFVNTPGIAWGVAVSGSYAYIADGGTGGLRVIDVSTPSSPFEVGFLDTQNNAVGVAVSGDYAYVADGNDGFRVIDVSDPFSPVEVGSHDTPGSAFGVAVAGGYAYVADQAAGMQIFRECPMFFDGFESGDLTAWSAAVP